MMELAYAIRYWFVKIRKQDDDLIIADESAQFPYVFAQITID